MASPPLEGRFTEAMFRIYDRAKRECNYNATRFLQMVHDHGGIEAARYLINSDQPSDGFTALWEHNRLDLTVEAHVLQEEFTALFTELERARARDRLREYGWNES